MKIVVIGRTGRVRSEIVERLRQAGHNAEVADTRVKFRTGAPRDPGHAGRHLRTLLERVAAALRDQWLNREARAAQLRQLLAGREASGSSSEVSRSGPLEETIRATSNPMDLPLAIHSRAPAVRSRIIQPTES